MYSCSQYRVFEGITPGNVLFASKVKVCSHTTGSHHPRVIFLMTVSTTRLLTWPSIEVAKEEVNLPDYVRISSLISFHFLPHLFMILTSTSALFFLSPQLEHIDTSKSPHKELLVGEGGIYDPEIPYNSLKDYVSTFEKDSTISFEYTPPVFPVLHLRTHFDFLLLLLLPLQSP